MRFYTKPHQFYWGIDLHARTMVPLDLESGRGERAAPPSEGRSRTGSHGPRACSGGPRRVRGRALPAGRAG
jgi:hypothetical protein